MTMYATFWGRTEPAQSARRSIAVALCALMSGCVSAIDDPDIRVKQQDVEESAAPTASASASAAYPAIRSSVRSTDDGVEVEIQADRPFEFGAMPPVLVIGNSAFVRSRYPADGNLHTLIFVIAADEYEALSSDARVSFGYLKSSVEFEFSPNQKGAAIAPKMRPDQVKEPHLQLGNLRKRQMEISQ
jgi:hypothetical protein